MGEPAALSAEEAERYDRQIRLWGMQSQLRMRDARVLVVGVDGTHAELLKNIVLSGVGSVYVMDGGRMTMRDLSYNFLLQESLLGLEKGTAVLPRLQELNPRVQLMACSATSVDQWTPEWLREFDVVCMQSTSIAVLAKANDACRRAAVKFFGSVDAGKVGVFFADLGASYEFTEKRKNVKPVESAAKHVRTCGSGENCAASATTTAAVAAAASSSAAHDASNGNGCTKDAAVDLSGDKDDDRADAEPDEVEVSRSFAYCSLGESVLRGTWATVPNAKLVPKSFFALQVLGLHQVRHPGPASAAAADEDLALLAGAADDAARVFAERGALASQICDAADVRHLAAMWGKHYMPVCSVVGGELAQEVLKVVTRHDVPMRNWFVFDMSTFDGQVVELLPPSSAQTNVNAAAVVTIDLGDDSD